MNIDVREYLRINPISVHELTLSGDAKDCFLYFPPIDKLHENSSGYKVYTQEEVFWSIYQAIFCDLIQGDKSQFSLRGEINIVDGKVVVDWDDAIHLKTTQFRQYVRDHHHEGDTIPNWDDYKAEFEDALEELERNIARKLAELRQNAKVNYSGAVELQSSLALKYKLLFDIEKFLCAEGTIWCYDENAREAVGQDRVEMSDPLLHGHHDTKAEAMTTSFSKNRGGGSLVGQFSQGSKTIVSTDENFNLSPNVIFGMTDQELQDQGLTYPLWGQNVLDWRSPTKTHNNIPPSSNVWVRYKKHIDAESRGVAPDMADIAPRAIEGMNAVEAQYHASTVAELESYWPQDLTPNDCLLRMSLDGMPAEDGVKLRKQTVQMLLDIFAGDGGMKLGRYVGDGGTFVNMQTILEPILDRELVLQTRFLSWLDDMLERLGKAQEDLDLIRKMLSSMKPAAYVGRIIMSTTDDVEAKVIANYGGKRWRRMVNFLRGVAYDDAEMGNKLGEEYVCLRESNVPIHTHQVQLLGVGEGRKPETTGPASWSETGRTGRQTVAVNVQQGEVGSQAVSGTKNAKLDYEISPLDYEKEGNFTVPHDNLPPYREVYIWECLEVSDEEDEVVHEIAPYFVVEWMPHNGEPVFRTRVEKTDGVSIPQEVPNKAGNTFLGWWTEEVGGEQVEDGMEIKSDRRFHAHWNATEYSISYVTTPGAVPPNALTKYTTQILPYTPPDPWPVTGYTFNGWSPERIAAGQTGDKTFTALWTGSLLRILFDKNGGHGGTDKVTATCGQPMPTIEIPVKVGNTFAGYFTQTSINENPLQWYLPNGESAMTCTLVQDTTMVAKWNLNDYTITFNGNGGSVCANPFEQGTPTMAAVHQYGSKLGELPNARPLDEYLENSDWTTLGFDGWYTERLGGRQISHETKVVEDATYYAQYLGQTKLSIKGTPSVSRNSFGAFGQGDCLQSNAQLDISKDFEIVVNATTGADVVSNQLLFGCQITLGIANGKFSWGIEGHGQVESTDGACIPGVNYWLRLVKENGTLAGMWRRRESDEWTMFAASDIDLDGKTRFNMGNGWNSSAAPWLGTIDLDKSYIAFDGNRYKFDVIRNFRVGFHSNYHRTDAWHYLDAHFVDDDGLQTPTMGYGNDGYPGIEVVYGQNYPALPIPVSHGYQFSAWRDGVDGDDSLESCFPPGNTPPNPVKITKDSLFWAIWKPCKYAMFVNPNGGFYKDSKKPTQVSPNGETWLTTQASDFSELAGVETDATRFGYALRGFYDDANGGTKVYDNHGHCMAGKYWSNDEQVEFKGLPHGQNSMTVYAQWDAIEYDIEYDTALVDAAVPETANYPRKYTVEDTIVPAPLPNHQQYEFVKWEPTSISRGSSGLQRFTAEWTVRDVTVTFDPNGGELVGQQAITMAYGDAVPEEDIPTATLSGFVFAGWQIGGTDEEFTSETDVVDDITCHAKWSENVTVTFRDNIPVTISYDRNF